jgi:hypothetical protein
MGRINLQSLIDEVLGMAKGSQDLRKKKVSEDAAAQVNQSWDSTPEGQGYWKDIRGRETQRQSNMAALNLASENNAGQLARQQLQQDFTNQQNIRTSNIDLFKAQSAANINRFNAQTERQTAMDKSGVSKAEIEGATAILNSMDSSPELKTKASNYLESILSQRQQRPRVPAPVNPAPGIPAPQTPAYQKPAPGVKEPDGIIPDKKEPLIGKTRTDRPEDYNIFGMKKPEFISEFIDYSGSAPAVKPQKKKISDMSEEEVIAEQNLYNKKYGVNIGGKRFTLPFTPTSPIDEWRKSKFGE